MKDASPSYLKHHFLIAMPHMADPHFAQTVTYIIDHNEHGAMGLVINKPNGLNLADVLEQLRPMTSRPCCARACLSLPAGPYRPIAALFYTPVARSFRPPLSWASWACRPRRTCYSPLPTAPARRNT